VVLGALALAVAAVAALVTLVVIMRVAGQRQMVGMIATATGEATPATPAANATPCSAQPRPATGGQIIHTVQLGETLIGIANQYGVPVELIQSANHLKNPRLIIPGQQLIIPDTLILTPGMPLGTLPPSPTATLPAKTWQTCRCCPAGIDR